MLLSDGNLREANFIIRAHGERWADETFKVDTQTAPQSRLMFVLQGNIDYEIEGKKYNVTQNQLMLIPERRRIKFGVPKGGFVHMHYCNFTAVLNDECIFDYMDGEWVTDVPDPGDMEKKFSRFHWVDRDNLILDCLEKRSNLLSILLEFVKRSGLKTITYTTKTGGLFYGIAAYIKRSYQAQNTLTIEELARLANMHPHYFSAEFKRRFGKTPIQYGLDAKSDKAKEYLAGSDMSINAISEALGFENPKYFSKFFKRRTGQTPTEYRKGHKPSN